MAFAFAGTPVQALELMLQSLQFFVAEIFEIDEASARSFYPAQQLIQFEMDRFGIAILCVLEEEHHQKSHDGGSSIDDQLPRIRIVKDGSDETPHCNDQESGRKGPG